MANDKNLMAENQCLYALVGKLNKSNHSLSTQVAKLTYDLEFKSRYYEQSLKQQEDEKEFGIK